MDMAYLAAGYIDGLWACGNVKIWDLAAGYIIMKEAGAVVTDIHGTSNLESSLIVAGNKKSNPNLLKF